MEVMGVNSNAEVPMTLTPLLIVTEVRDKQVENEETPMVITVLGMMMEVSPVSVNAKGGMTVIPEPIVTAESDAQPSNTPSRIVVTELGIMTEVSAVLENAYLFRVTTVFGMMTLFNEEHRYRALSGRVETSLAKVMCA
jgi:hypothetical protein